MCEKFSVKNLTYHNILKFLQCIEVKFCAKSH